MKIIYVDDCLELDLSKYLYKKFSNDYEEIEFQNMTYDDLYTKLKTKIPYILIIDSQLFINRSVLKKFSGEEFKVILKKLSPYSETIVLTQNDNYNEIGAVRKYRVEDGDAANYYESALFGKIVEAQENINIYQKIIDKMSIEDGTFDTYLLEQIKNSISGIDEYDLLKIADVDRLVEAFKALKEEM